MDEAAAAEIKEGGAEKRPHNGNKASENNIGSSVEDIADVKQFSLECKDCGLKFTHQEVFETHLHQHAMEEEEEEEEEDAAQTGDNRNPSERDPEGGNDRENGNVGTGDGADGCDVGNSSQTKPSVSVQGVGVASGNKFRKVYTCLDCGKVYFYLVSFRKHQQLHENQLSTTKSEAKSQSVENLHKYQCPECGMSFIRRVRLLGHLRVHRPRTPPRCDQCDKDFTSEKSLMAHADLHQQRPFWCLSCAKGFIDERTLDKHLQGHSQRQHKCNICHKSFYLPSHLKIHYNSHTGAKPYQCTLCGKSFAFPRNLVSHRKKHLRVHVLSSGISLGMKNSAIIAKNRVFKKKKLRLPDVKEEPEMDTNMEELPGKEECVQKSELQKSCEDAEFEDHADSDESDCGEPVHYFRPSKPSGSAGSKLGTVEPQAGQELDKSESQETHMHRQHKYWEWECCDCDMGFDEVAELHLHYIKHATGELPIPQDDNDD
uniref:zinc finger protein 501 isoform X3 n=1 Tax=Scatophagus argus TaxID=75038 RepID=UPI001ED862F5|nr:zinc finger protein 501 isoform X3 [Scatophagus argus]